MRKFLQYVRISKSHLESATIAIFSHAWINKTRATTFLSQNHFRHFEILFFMFYFYFISPRTDFYIFTESIGFIFLRDMAL